MSAFIIADSGTWTLSTLIWLPVAVFLTIGSIVAAILLWRCAQSEKGERYGDRGPALFLFGCSIFCALCVVIATTVGMYPYSAEYHQWRETSGTVTKIDKRLISTGDGMSDKFVVRFDGDGQQFGCDDTRCASVEVGDALTLSCKRAWQYTGTDGYDCRFVSTEAAS